ncbi:MAG: hypothetical protein B6243_03195 [Anaerolineaceae bacterium 4572_5.2]|nr:MAG: hypothetical protein B6243_03195 [Anaerolineaceae bacterium 4572_5.2]
MKLETKNPKPFFVGIALIALGLLANEQTLTALFSADGFLSPRSVVIIWLFDAAMVVIGLTLVISRSFARLIDLFVGLAITALIIFGAEKYFYRLNHPPAPQASAERPQGSVHQEGTYTQNFFQDDDLLGYIPVPNTRVNSIKKLGDDLIYDVEYSIDQYSRREVPGLEFRVSGSETSNTKPETRNQFILFFGGSFIFGEGLNDDETLPAHVGRLAPRYRPYNYGLSGYGPQQMLANTYFHINLPAKLTDRHYAFAVRVIAEARDAFLQQYPAGQFYVLIYPDEGDYFEDMQPHLDAAGLKILNYDELIKLDPNIGLSIAGDGHPTGKAHQIVAEHLVSDLDIGAHPLAAPDPRFGLVQTYDDFDAAEELGAGFTRIKLYWDVIQPNGPDDWKPSNVPDPLVDADLAAGREVVGLIVRTPAWAQAPGNPANDPANPQPKDVPDMDAWGNFVRQLVKQYDGKIHHWIIWNEPDVWDPNHPGSTWNGSEEDYFRLLKTAWLNIKAVDPQSKVYLSGFTYWWDEEYDREQYLSRLLKIIIADPQAAANDYYFDGAIYHLYYKPQQIYDLLSEARGILERYGLGGKALWLNETNAPPSSDPVEPPHREPRFKASLDEQAAFMIQVHAMAFAASAERVQVYKLYNSAEHPEDVQPFGLLRGDKSRRPAFYAYQVVTSYLSDFEKATLFQQGDVNTVVFEQPGKVTTVLWNVAQTPRTVTVNAITDRALLVDELGHTQTITAERGLYALELPPATCSDGACFIGGPPRLIMEQGAPDQRQPMSVAPTPTPVPPTQVKILMVSPRRRAALFVASLFAFMGVGFVLWRRWSR